MINQIVLKNFKIFREESIFNFSNINLLTGINGRGKSTLLQSLLLFRQSLEDNPNTSELLLNGTCVQLGEFSDIKNSSTKNDVPVHIRFSFQSASLPDTGLVVSYDFHPNDTDTVSLALKKCRIESNKSNFFNPQDKFTTSCVELMPRSNSTEYDETWHSSTPKTFRAPSNVINRFAFLKFDTNELVGKTFSLQKMHYIGADRLGSQNFYIKHKLSATFATVDKQGKNVASIIAQKQSDNVAGSLIFDSSAHPNVKIANKSETLITQLGNWLSYITDTNEVQVEVDNTNAYVISLFFKFGANKFKPANVGFGYSYILSILVAGLIANDNEIIIVENPEAHLHPRAQTRLAEFLAKVSQRNVQVFIESHSDHILNALRVCVKKDTLKHTQIKVLYFNTTQVSCPTIDEDGRIDEWEDGFFDEWEKKLIELL